MNYYYDIILNWNDGISFNFYEWNDTDALELVKKIPLIKVSHKVLMDLTSFMIKVDKDFLNLIEDRTLASSKKNLIKIKYAALFTDSKNVIAIEFKEDGESMNYSSLMMDDELNVLEAIYNLKVTEFNYELKDKINYDSELRQIRDAKKLIELEMKELYEKEDLSKLRYLFYEYKKEKSEDMKYIYDTLKEDLDHNFNKDILKLYDIIKLSYHKV